MFDQDLENESEMNNAAPVPMSSEISMHSFNVEMNNKMGDIRQFIGLEYDILVGRRPPPFSSMFLKDFSLPSPGTWDGVATLLSSNYILFVGGIGFSHGQRWQRR
ncbi:hypothetical protein TNCV_4572861 [Trichonephila clavipes]|nr:hypothetical protein TNCV_4572861 [Trichonephila clavipes]